MMLFNIMLVGFVSCNIRCLVSPVHTWNNFLLIIPNTNSMTQQDQCKKGEQSYRSKEFRVEKETYQRDHKCDC